MSIELPPAFLAFSGRGPDWTRWLDRLPRLVADLVTAWELRVDGSATHGENAVVVPVRTAAGEAAALKVSWPHDEAAHEHLVLRAWDGGGAVRLLRADPRRWALLLERAEPGHDLHELDVLDACEVVGALYARLHRAPLPQLMRLSAHAARWAVELETLRGSPLAPRRFVDQAVGLARDLASDPATDRALIHTDLHYANVLAGAREPWLAIDPKPLAGDPAYEVAPLLWNRWEEAVATHDLRGALLDRLYAVVDAAGLDEDRVRDWVTVRMMVQVLDGVTEGWAQRDPGRISAATTIVKAVQR